SLSPQYLLDLLLGLVSPPQRGLGPGPQLQGGCAVDQLNEKSSEANLYRLLELDPPPEQDDKNSNIPKPVSFRVKETVCPRTSQQPAEQCDFKENGLLKECVGTVTLDQVGNNFDITCAAPQSVRGLGGLGRKILRGVKTYGPAVIRLIGILG
ncbi:hypothetical protein K5549_021568, partial [Capra hircus]